MNKAAVIAVAVMSVGLTLSACKPNEQTTRIGDTTYSVNEATGQATITTAEGSVTAVDGAAAANTAMPDHAPRYPGATITSAMTSHKGEAKITNVILETPDTPEAVAAFYREKFTAAGLTLGNGLTTSESIMLTAERNGRNTTVIANREENKTSILVTFAE